jgi:uncharacterized Fe-S center protein
MAERVLVAMRTMQHRFFLCVGCLSTCSRSLCKREWQHRWTAFLVVLLEFRDSVFRVRTQGLSFIGCT